MEFENVALFIKKIDTKTFKQRNSIPKHHKNNAKPNQTDSSTIIKPSF